MTSVAVASQAPKPSDEDGDKFIIEARNAALHALRKQKLLKEKKAQRRAAVTLRAIDEKKSGKRRDD